MVPQNTLVRFVFLLFLAPEVIRGSGHDHACDWWAVGVLVYELHYGRTPFYAQRPTQIYEKIESHRYPINYFDERNPPIDLRKKKLGMLKGKHVLSSACKDLVAKFLVPKSALRLGYVKPGPEKVRQHSYFKGHSSFSWDKLADLTETPPFIIDLPAEEQIENLEQDPKVRYQSAGRDRSSWIPQVNTMLEKTPKLVSSA